MATNSALVGDVVAAIDSRMQALVEARLTNRVPPALQDLQARAITAALHGLKSQATSYDDLAALITQFARLIGAGLPLATPA
jgi:type II secretory pathway component PulF